MHVLTFSLLPIKIEISLSSQEYLFRMLNENEERKEKEREENSIEIFSRELKANKCIFFLITLFPFCDYVSCRVK